MSIGCERNCTNYRKRPDCPSTCSSSSWSTPIRGSERLTDEIEATHAQSETSQRLATIPGVGKLSATIIAATTPDVGNFDCARDYAAWLGLTPKPALHRR